MYDGPYYTKGNVQKERNLMLLWLMTIKMKKQSWVSTQYATVAYNVESI